MDGWMDPLQPRSWCLVLPCRFDGLLSLCADDLLSESAVGCGSEERWEGRREEEDKNR